MATNTDTIKISSKYEFTPGQALKPWHFRFCLIEDRAMLSESFRLRYEVYCKERQFLPPESFPAKLEIDPFDSQSIHIAGINQDGLMIGTVRLVLPSPIGFPLFEHCEFFPEYRHLLDKISQQASAEISRLAVSKLYRRRQNDGLYGLAYQSDFDGTDTGRPSLLSEIPGGIQDRRSKPEIILGLYKGIYQASKRKGITHWFVAMEKTLLRLLHRFNIDFTPIGPELDYYGPVTPYFATIAEIEETVYRNNPGMFLEFMTGLEPEFVPEYARKLVQKLEDV